MKARVQTPTNELVNSLNFYQKIGFTVLTKEHPCILTDGKVLLEINPDRFARAGIKLFSDHWDAIISDIESLVTVTTLENGYLFADPSGTWVYLLENEAQTTTIPENISAPVIGQLAGLSMESTAIKTSIALWETLGFGPTMGGLDQGWIVMTNTEGFSVSIMKPMACPHLFFNPSFTYFNGKKNLAIIEKIRALNIPITEEITHFNKQGIVDNIIIRDPGGFGFFIFSD